MKGGINFEEWKEIVKKNRRSLRSKSNSFKFEPESLTYGAEKAVKSPEYGQVHTITYNVTGMDIPSSWPTEIKSGKTLVLDGITVPYGATATVSASVSYTYENGVLTISNVQNAPNITINISDILYQNAKVGDYLYSDWTFGPTQKAGYLGRCVSGLLMVNGSNVATKSIWAISSEEPMAWSTESIDTGLPNLSSSNQRKDKDGQEHTQTLLALGADKYPAAAWAAQQFDGLGYLPACGEVYECSRKIRDLDINANKRLWVSTETNGYRGYAYEAVVLQASAEVFSYNSKGTSTGVYSVSFCKLSGPIGKPINNNGHDYVDLGLPSGTLWATMNVGATSETEYGNYYMYGMGSKTFDSTDTPYAGTEDPLDLSKDTARQTWGGDWHMPTETQCYELIENTTYQWVDNYQESGINGATFTAQNGNVLFIPAASCFWVDTYDGTVSPPVVGNTAVIRTSSPAPSTYTGAGANTMNVLRSSINVDFITSFNNEGYSVRPVIG